MPIITLLTDFGNRDSYVAEVKGVILSICPNATLVDISHEVAPQNVAEGAFLLAQAAPYFPTGTVHLAVVDPGVGSQRAAVAVCVANACFVGPDNGLLQPMLERVSGYTAVSLSNRAYWRVAQPSATFHGRDVFAPVAAHLANGVPLAALGPMAVSLASLPQDARPARDGEGWRGQIIHVDRFGNLISNIPGEWLADGQRWVATIAGRSDIVLVGTYADVAPGAPLMLVGSHGYVELAVNRGSAAAMLGVALGATLCLHPPANE